MGCPIIVRSHSSSWDHSGPTMHLLLMPRLERIMQPSRIHFAVNVFFSYYNVQAYSSSAYCTKPPPFYNFRKRSKKDKALRHNCRSYCDKCISVQRFLCFRFTGNAITLITYVCSCRQHLRYKTQPYP